MKEHLDLIISPMKRYKMQLQMQSVNFNAFILLIVWHTKKKYYAKSQSKQKNTTKCKDLGYRHFDCAPAYQNESYVGKGIKEVLKKHKSDTICRESLIIGSKLGNDGHQKHDVSKHFFRSLKELDLQYLDIYMIHWPWPNFHPPGLLFLYFFSCFFVTKYFCLMRICENKKSHKTKQKVAREIL